MNSRRYGSHAETWPRSNRTFCQNREYSKVQHGVLDAADVQVDPARVGRAVQLGPGTQPVLLVLRLAEPLVLGRVHVAQPGPKTALKIHMWTTGTAVDNLGTACGQPLKPDGAGCGRSDASAADTGGVEWLSEDTYHQIVHLLAVVPLVVGLVIAVVGVLGLRERLPRNRFGGVRTPATMRSDQTFRVANKVAGLPVAVAGGVGTVSGAVGLLAANLVIAGVGLVGMVGIALAGGIVGHRAAEALPDEEPELPAGCRGCACGGCDLAKSVGANVTRVGGE